MRRLAVALAALLATGAARANERITSFDAHVVADRSGLLTVTETIRVRSEGERIRHGITREIPTRYATGEGLRQSASLAVSSVALDGHSEPYALETVDSGVRIRIGDASAMIPPGDHSFVITYFAGGEIGFFPDHDEIDWNVTGNFWRFPIDHATALVELPDGGDILRYAAYTGSAGATAHNATAMRVSDHAMRFATTAPLGVAEGLTVAVGFTKGAIAEPGLAERLLAKARANLATVVATAGLLLMGLVFSFPLTRLRSLRRGVIIPLFAPPVGMAPGAARYVYNEGYDRKAYSASIVDLAIKKFLTISEVKKVFTVTRTGIAASDAGLASEENALAGALFAARTSVAFAVANRERIAASIDALNQSLVRSYGADNFQPLGGWGFGGITIFVATVAWVFLLIPDVSWLTVVPLVVALVALIVFMTKVRLPTQAGVTLREHIKGFRLFLATAEKDRLEALNPPTVTPAVFERFLPYAIALDCENRWAKRFAAEAAAAGALPGDPDWTYSPGWTDSDRFDASDPGRFSDLLGMSMASSAADATSGPGSSSGSDGGGSSGDGGGGGGGDGW